MNYRKFLAIFLLCPFAALAAVVDQEVEIEGYFLKLGLHPDEGGVLSDFGLLSAPGNMAGPDGLLQEGFGVGSFYVPNRRINERLEVMDQIRDRPVFVYSYDCDGPNISGLRVQRRMEMDPNEASMRITWTIENRGTDKHWVAPWVKMDATVGGDSEERDRLEFFSLAGKQVNPPERYYPASRNWAAITDPIEQQTLYGVFDADRLHSLLAIRADDGSDSGFAAHFVPFLLDPGQTWETVYRLNAARGLTHVDFATDELAVQLDYEGGKLKALMSAAKQIDGLEIHARVMAKNGRVWSLPGKRFDIGPKRLVRASYDWEPPANGGYEFLAELRQGGQPFFVGRDTRSPHGGFDTQFVIGDGSVPLEAWSNAPYALEQQPRELRRSLAADGPLQVWQESTMQKVLLADAPESSGRVEPTVRMSLARNEHESLQLALRTKAEAGASVQVRVSDLRNGDAVIPARGIRVYQVGYVDSRAPSHWEGPTGAWPDALEPMATAQLTAGRTQPIWITVYAPNDAAPGAYRGTIEITGTGFDPIEVSLLAEVYDFTLPTRASLQTDFGFDFEQAKQLHRMAGGRLSDADLRNRFAENALRHRVTLRGLTELPAESPDYGRALEQYASAYDELWGAVGTSFSVPASLLEFPEQLQQANDFVKRRGISDRAFVHLFVEPVVPAWERVLETMQRWSDTAPDIPIRVSTLGLRPFLPDTLETWMVHAQVLDTNNGVEVLKRIGEGKPVWWYVHHLPPRPYGNFFLDFAGIEHRILFWQTWALGMRGMHYWDVQHVPGGLNPRVSQLDVTPVNGDGFLIYPGADGPVNSQRWEIIRDGIEDYDYLTEFMKRRRQLLDEGGHATLLSRAAEVYDLGELVPTLVSFPRDPALLESKRHQIARMIEEMDRALK